MTQTLKLQLLDSIVDDIIAGNDVSYAPTALRRLRLSESMTTDGACLVPLTQGQFALVDLADFPAVSQHKWWAIRDLQKAETYYARTKINGRSIPLHNFLMPPAIGMRTDHRDRDGLNCRRSNLREATKYQNAQNRRSWRVQKDGSKFKGVYPVKNRASEITAWRSVIKANKIMYDLGRFSSDDAAARAYDAKARELHGEFAVFNFAND